MKRLLINLLALFVWNKTKRHQLRFFLSYVKLQSFLSLFHWNKEKIKENSVLLIETNNCHGEVIAGYLEYFQKLGFNIDILVNWEILNEDPFCRLDLSKVRIASCDFATTCFFLNSTKILGYKHIIVMTSACYFINKDRQYTSVLENYPSLKKHKSLFIVEHDTVDINRFNEDDFVKNKKLITLGHFPCSTFVCPFLFGSKQLNLKNKLTTFVCIGSISNARKNHRLLIDAVMSLAKDNQKFRVVVVGEGDLKNIPKEVLPYITFMGRLNFKDMFNTVESADFYLPLLDPNNEKHFRYITTGVSGSAQLIYGFSKVPVIHSKFASFYGFDKQNAIIYDDLYLAMREAISLDDDEYVKKQQCLSSLTEKLYLESLENLKEILK